MDQTERSDMGKRAVVFTKKPSTVLIKVASKRNLGLRSTDRDDVAVQAKHQQLANKLGVNQFAYAEPKKRVVPDTGIQVIKGEYGINMADLLTELENQGYKLRDSHSFSRPGKDRMNVFSFSIDGEGEDVASKELKVFLRDVTVNGVFVWANRTEDGERLDTINCVDAGADGRYSKKITMVGNTYKVNPR